eukprot:gb/GECH01003386.1/.p1 GENE.gb/GECH01003386.1/~~gb/GECH01003386.1/.p1  ORF type:complete len:899 (+),score=169.03 gb/GECH01003386.1/:1-2697(+)
MLFELGLFLGITAVLLVVIKLTVTGQAPEQKTSIQENNTPQNKESEEPAKPKVNQQQPKTTSKKPTKTKNNKTKPKKQQSETVKEVDIDDEETPILEETQPFEAPSDPTRGKSRKAKSDKNNQEEQQKEEEEEEEEEESDSDDDHEDESSSDNDTDITNESDTSNSVENTNDNSSDDDVYVSDYDSEVETYSFADKKRLRRKTQADRGSGTLSTRPNVPGDTPESAASTHGTPLRFAPSNSTSTESKPEEVHDDINTDQLKPAVSDGNLFKQAIYPDDSDDSSEDEDMVNTVGRIPLRWYNDYDHIGYDREGQPIIRKDRGDKLDELVRRHDDPNWLRTVYDAKNDREYTFSNEELDVLLRVSKGHFPNPETNPFEEYVAWFDYRGGALDDRDPSKKRFQPSAWERKKMMRLADKFRREGIPDHLKPSDERQNRRHKKKRQPTYLMWDESGQVIGDRGNKGAARPPAPKSLPPTIEQSYRPPAEYEPRRQYPSLRRVPAYRRFMEERFERCMYLYLAPRQYQKRLKNPIRSKDLLPELPDVDSLRPFPTTMTLVYRGHTDHVRSVSVDPTGQYLASGSEDGTVRLWEVETGKCMQVWHIGRQSHTDPQPVTSVAWNPSPVYHMLAACCGTSVHLIAPPATAPSQRVRDDTVAALQQRARRGMKSRAQWTRCPPEQQETGREMEVHHRRVVVNVSWHRRGDYLASLGLHGSVSIHQLSRKQSQEPFRKGMSGPHMPRVSFHPTKPLFYVVTMYMVRVYDLVKQKLVKKFRGRCRWISDLAIHPSGNFFLTSGYDRLVEFFDMELTLRPFRTFKYHKNAARSVAFHPKYPLFASASDDMTIHMFHCRVYDDWMQDPTILPVKILRGHARSLGIGVLDLTFHPQQPWLFSAGADNTLRLWT